MSNKVGLIGGCAARMEIRVIHWVEELVTTGYSRKTFNSLDLMTAGHGVGKWYDRSQSSKAYDLEIGGARRWNPVDKTGETKEQWLGGKYLRKANQLTLVWMNVYLLWFGLNKEILVCFFWLNKCIWKHVPYSRVARESYHPGQSL